LEITPTYHFTRNGQILSRFYEERLSGIKRLEKQNKVHRAQVNLWAKLLQRRDEMFGAPTTFLKFGDLVSFQAEWGIDDSAWAPNKSSSEDESNSQRTLFDL
jgi:hypothetical protein